MFLKKDKNDIINKFAEYRINSDQTNAAYKIPVKNDFVFLKIYGSKYPRLKYELRKLLAHIGFRQPVEYRPPEKRRDHEVAILCHWSANGYAVPHIVNNPFHELLGFPVLTTTFIEGLTLRQVLKSSFMVSKEKAENLAALFAGVAARHHQGFASNDNRLFHIDANTRNIIFAKKAVYHVDFEMGRPWEPVPVCATREVLKLLVSIAEDTELSARETVFRLFKKYYAQDDVYMNIVKSVKGRPFQAIHRYNSRRKKQQDSNKITLYEVLQYLS